MNISNSSRSERFRYSKVIFLTTCAAMLAIPTQAIAQNTQADTEAQAKAKANSSTNAASDNAPEGTIIVTGSRIARKDYDATSPIVTVDSELLQKSSSVNLEANLNKLPQFSPALSQYTTADVQANANNTIGIATVSLRQLGANRNLVLVDGRRPTPSNGSGVVDINTIPSSAVDRVEVITGGASSTYGADAVGGVVNFILKKNFQGLTVDSQVAETQRGDGLEYRVSLLAGMNSPDGKGNVMFGMEHYGRGLVHRRDRPWYDATFRDPSIPGTETFLAENFVTFPTGAAPSQTAVNNLFRSKGAPSTVTLPSGSTATLNVSNLSSLYVNPNDGSLFVNTSAFVGTGTDRTYVPELYGYTGGVDGLQRKKLLTGVLSDNNLDEILSSRQKRWTFFAKTHYDLGSHISFIGQANYSHNEVPSLLLYTVAINAFATPIPHGSGIYTGNSALGIPSSVNADGTTNSRYLPGGQYGLNCPATGGCTNSQVFPTPPELTALLDGRAGAAANQPFYINVTPDQLGRRVTDNRTNTFQFLAGFEGDIPGTDWTWDATASHGESDAKTLQSGFISVNRWKSVLTAPNYGLGLQTLGDLPAPGNGRNGADVSCTSGLNPFTDVTWSSDCISAVEVNLQNENRLKQDIAEANAQGGLFDLPYGQLRAAIGADYRKESINFTPDSSATEGSSFLEPVMGISPQGPTKGSTTVKEIYGEALIPILKNLPFARVLNLELGYRLSDYRSIGTVSTYKLNGEYAPFEWLRFRGGYQKASRAPNLGELYTAATQNFAFGLDGDPCSRGNTVAPVGIGNYSANASANPDAAKVEALCRALMTTDGANTYYRSGRVYAPGAAFVSSQIIGNNGLKQEDAKTYTIGAVISSPIENPWLHRLRLSVDYYNVDLTNAIAQQSVDVAYRLCFSGLYNPNYDTAGACQNIERDPSTGEAFLVKTTFSNLGRVKVDGVDVQADWGITFRDGGVPLPGTFSTNVQFTYLNHFETTTDQKVVPLVDYAGTLGGGEVGTNAGAYRWRLFTTFNYTVGPANVSVQWQHKPAVASVNSVTSTNSQVTGAPAYDLFSLSASYRVTSAAVLRFGVDNLFDKWPPLTGVNMANDPTQGQLPGGAYNVSQYDVLGRRFYAGLNYKF